MTIPEFPFFEDRSHEPQPSHCVDRISNEDWPEFCSQVAQANKLAVEYDPNARETAQWIGEQVAELEFIFGGEYCKKYCRVLGLAYNEHHVRSGIAQPSETVSVNTDSASLQGVDMQYINGAWHTLLQFHVAKHTNELPSGMYYIPPDPQFLLELVVDLAYDEDDDEFDDAPTVAQMFAKDTETAQALVAHEYFDGLDPAEQRDILEDIIMDADNSLDPDQCGKNVVVESLKHYVAYDDMPIDLLDSCTDYTDASPDERQSIEGTIEGFVYPELATLPANKQLTHQDFVYNNGAPCLKLRNDDLGRTYYSIPQSILDII